MTEQALDRARGGDEAAFRALTDPYRRELHVHCYRILGSVQERGGGGGGGVLCGRGGRGGAGVRAGAGAEGGVEETLLAAGRGLAGFEERASLRAWLYRIATNRSLNARRDSARRPSASMPLPPQPPPPTP